MNASKPAQTEQSAIPTHRIRFDIARQELSEALIELGEQASLSVLIHDDVIGIETAGLRANLTIQEALDRLLAHTGLGYGVKGGAIIVSRPVAELTAHRTRGPNAGDSGTPPAQSTQRRWYRALVRAVAVALTAAQPATAEDSDDEKTAEDDEPETVIVVGTRLTKGDPTARVIVMSREDIEALGLSTAEEVVRSIPQNLSTINGFNNLVTREGIDSVRLGQLGLGVSTANLRGMGTADTLVLVNGKRIASFPGHEDLFANIRHIPTAAIERVEVHLDGGSAVYGSEAVAGVINVVLREDFVGGSVRALNEVSSTDGDRRRLAIGGGYHWLTGSVSLNASLTESDPVNNLKTGWTTQDYSARYGGNQDYNHLHPYTCTPRSSRIGLRASPLYLVLTNDNDGRDAQIEDYRVATLEDCADAIPLDAGGTRRDRSITANVRQHIGRITLTGEYLGTKAETEARLSMYSFRAWTVPASNAFNNWEREMYVTYNPTTEVERGLIPPNLQTDVSNQERYSLALESRPWEGVFGKVEYSRGKSWGRGEQYLFSPPRWNDSQDVVDRLNPLLESDDPTVALNLFGDGTGQNPTIAEFFKVYANEHAQSYVESQEGHVALDVVSVPAGQVGMVIGFERRRQWIEELRNDAYRHRWGFSRPTRKFSTTFAELKFPIIAESSMTGLRDLTLTTQVHRDQYSTRGAVGRTEDGAPDIRSLEINNTSRRFGVLWTVTDDLKLRLSRAESFRPPSFGELFDTYNVVRQLSNWVYDPLSNPRVVTAYETYGPNPDLKPQHAVNRTLSIDWRPTWMKGLGVNLAVSEIDYVDRIANSRELERLLSFEEFYNLEEFFVRDSDGTLLEKIVRPINVARRVNQTIDCVIDYSFSTDWGNFHSSLVYHYVLKMFDQAKREYPEVDFVGRTRGLDKWKARLALHWSREGMSGDLAVNYTPSYINDDWEGAFWVDIPNEDVEAYWTLDLSGRYKLANGITIRGGGRNILDADFPFVFRLNSRPWDPRRVDLRKRVLFLEVAYDLPTR